MKLKIIISYKPIKWLRREKDMNCQLIKESLWVVLIIYLTLFSIAMINTMTESKLVKNSIFEIILLGNGSQLKDVSDETQGRYLESGLKKKAWRNAAYYFDSHGLHCFSYTTQDHLFRDGTTHNFLGLPIPICDPRKCLTEIPPSQSDGDIFFNKSSLFPNDSSWCQGTKNPNKYKKWKIFNTLLNKT